MKSVNVEMLRRYVRDARRFVRRELEVLRQLDHPQVVRLYEAFEDEKTLHLCMELLEGGDLLERVTCSQERLPERLCSELLLQMLCAIQHLHLRGMAHRDLKPENFFFSTRGPGSPLKLIDFGLSRKLSFEAGTRLTPKIGTAEYMAPEALTGRVSASLADRADMYSLGVVLHVVFIGHFPAPSLAEMGPEQYLKASCWSQLSAPAKDVLAQLLRQEPSRRPPVDALLRHSWVAGPAAPTSSLRGVGRFAASSRLRRLSLLAVAREVSDADAAQARCVFLELQRQAGALTRSGLEKIRSERHRLSELCAELVAGFSQLDVDQSGTLDWSELLAAFLGCLVPLREDAVWRAFDTLGQGQNVSAGSLCGLLGASRVRMEELHQLVQEVELSGHVSVPAFHRLLA